MKTLETIRSCPIECQKPEFAALVFTSAARAVWNNHDKVLTRMLQQHTHLQQYLTVSSNSIAWIDRDGFAAAHSSAKAKAAQEKQQMLEAGAAPAQDTKSNTCQVSNIVRAAKLWLPFSSRMVLTAVQVDDKAINDPEGIGAALSEGWSRTFAVAPSIDTAQAQHYLETHAVPMDFSKCKPPTKAQVAELINKLPDSAPGPDGLPYSAWKAGGAESIDTTYNLIMHNLVRGMQHETYNDSLTVFLPRGEEETDTQYNTTRKVADTRPLSFKNTDNKLVCSCMNYSYKSALKLNITDIQRGFVPSRQLVNNIVDLDTYAHIHALSTIQERLPLLVFFDFAAAFPSVSHEYLMLALHAMKFPLGFINVIECIYINNNATYNTGNRTINMFKIVSGVLQGCPLSGFLFAICIDPFLRHCETSTLGTTSTSTPQHAKSPYYSNMLHVRECIIRACADDVGASMSDIKHLLSLHSCYTLMQVISGLRLKPKKCNIIPLYCTYNSTIAQLYTAWLKEHIPEWQSFAVTSHAKYLGLLLGPAAGEHQWDTATQKYKHRVHKIALLEAPIQIKSYLYNTNAVPVLQYIAQLLPIPRLFIQVELGLLHKMLHLPNNAFPLKAMQSFHLLGGPALSAVSCTSTAARIRASVMTLTGWKTHLDILKRVVELHMPTDQYVQGHRHAQHYTRPPIVYYIEAASELQADSKNVLDSQANIPRHKKKEIGDILQADPRGLQGRIYKIMMQDRFTKMDWAELFMTRLRKWLPTAYHIDLPLIEWDQVFAVMKTLGSQHSMNPIKSWSGSWCTGRRFHEHSPLRCVFGCDARDCWSHYIDCNSMWALISNKKITDTARQHRPLARLGLHPVCIGQMTKLHIAYTLYHHIKVGRRATTQAQQDAHNIDYYSIFQAAQLAVKGLSWNARAHARQALEDLRRTPRS